MKTDKYFIDTNIPIYAAGKVHEHKEKCINVLSRVAGGKLIAFTDTEVFQEILYRFIKQQNLKAGFQIFDYFLNIMYGNILPVTLKDIKELRILAEKYTKSQSRDLIHLSIMLTNGIEKIVTLDNDFKKFKEIVTLDPEDLV